MKIWKWTVCTLALALLGGCGGEGAGPSPAQGKGLAFVSNGVADFWTLAQRGVEQAGRDLEIRTEMVMPSDAVDQKNKLDDLVTRGVEGIAVSPIDPANQTPHLDEVAGRTLLVTVDSDAPESERLLYIGMDNYKAGRMCGELVKEILPDGGRIMIFVGRMEQDNARRRRQGLIDELLGREHDPTNFDEPGSLIEGGGFAILGTLTDQFDRPRAKANVEDTLARHPDIDGMVGLFAYNPPLILEALEQAGRLGQVKVVGFDENDETLQGIIDGSIHGTVVQDPYSYGYRSMEVLAALARGDRSALSGSGFVDIPARQIRSDNVESFWSDLKSKLEGPAPE